MLPGTLDQSNESDVQMIPQDVRWMGSAAKGGAAIIIPMFVQIEMKIPLRRRPYEDREEASILIIVKTFNFLPENFTSYRDKGG